MNIGIGNDIRVLWEFVGHDKREIDFSGSRKVEVVVRHSRYSNVTYIPPSLNILNGTIGFEIPSGSITYPGIYHMEMNAIWPSEEYADGDRKVSVIYRGAFSLSPNGGVCADLDLRSVICSGYEHPEGQQVTILKSRWGYVIGNIGDQLDLMKLLDEMEERMDEKIKKIRLEWGNISGDISNQTDLEDLIMDTFVKLFEQYGGGGTGSVFTVTASSSDIAKGTVSPTKQIVREGEDATIAAKAKTGNYIKSWNGAAGAEMTGLGDESGTIVIKDVKESKTVVCVFDTIPLFGLSTPRVELRSDGSMEEGLTVFSTKGWSIKGGTISGTDIKIPWSGSPDDYISVRRDGLVSGKEKVGIKSTANASGVNREKSVIFKEMETDKEATLVVFQPKDQGYRLTTSTAGQGQGEITSITPSPVNGYYAKGTEVTLVANDGATSGDKFDYWLVNGGRLEGRTITVTMNSDTTAIAYFVKRSEISRYRLSTGTAGAGNGTITSITPSSPDGYYDLGTEVTLVANNGNGSYDYFDHWTVNGENRSSMTIKVTMNEDITATAYFRYEDPEPGTTQYYLEVNADTGGSASGSGYYDEGSDAVATATPGAGYDFLGWTGDASGKDNPVNIHMDGNKSVTAKFSEKTQVTKRTLSVYIDGETWGYTNLYGGNISQHDHLYDDGEVVTLKASPYEFGEFVGWSGDITESAPSVQITMDSDKRVTATFRQKEVTPPDEYTISTNVSPANGGTVSVVDNTAHWSLTANPAEGWRFHTWAGDVSTAQKDNPSIAIQKDGNKTLIAYFVANTSPEQYTLAVNGSPADVGRQARFAIEGYAEALGPISAKVAGGQVVTIKCVDLPNGYYISGWTDSNGGRPDSGSQYFDYTMPNGDVTVTANFKQE